MSVRKLRPDDERKLDAMTLSREEALEVLERMKKREAQAKRKCKVETEQILNGVRIRYVRQ